MRDLDSDDIKASQEGDHEAYRRLVQQYEATVSNLMWRFSHQTGVCEELTQETFVQAYLSLRGARFRGSFEGRLKRIATRVGYRYWKQQQRARQFVSLDETTPFEAPKCRQQLADVECLAHQLLQRLPPTERLVLTLSYFDKCSTQDIAERLGWNRAMVKMRAHRARRKLKTIVERENLLDNFA